MVLWLDCNINLWDKSNSLLKKQKDIFCPKDLGARKDLSVIESLTQDIKKVKKNQNIKQSSNSGIEKITTLQF